jgi:hypothetical protein
MTLRACRRALVALTLLAAPGARAAAGGCALRVTAVPERLTLGEDEIATVRVEGRAAAPLLSVNLGSVGAPRRAGEGAWEADYRPPRRGFPRVALVSAVGEGTCGFVAIPLAGQGDALVDTSPRARISVRIGERRFGPERADDTGRAVVPVIVPPGVRAAFHGERAIPLDVPPSSHVHLTLLPAATPRADREEVLAVLAVAVAEDGSPWSGPPPALSASAGALSEPEAAAPGAFLARWRLPPGPARAESITAALGAEPLGARLEVERGAGPVAAVAVEAPALFTAGDERPLVVTARLADAAGNPADAEVELASDAGDVEPAERVAPGTYRGAVRLRSAFAGRGRATVVARAGQVEGSAAVRLAPGPVARVELAPAVATLAADARSELELLARPLDAHGNLVPGATPEVAAALGAVGPPRPTGDGFACSYRPPRLEDDGADALRAVAGSASGSAVVALVAPAPRLATALRAGISALGRASAAAQLGAQVASYRRVAGLQLGLALDLAWTTAGRGGAVDAAGAPAAVPVDGRTHHLALLVGPAWRGRSGPVGWWGAVGAGAARVSGALTVAGQPTVTDSAWVAAAAASLAVALPARRSLPFVELRAGWQGDPGLPRLHGALVPVTLALGYRHEAF